MQDLWMTGRLFGNRHTQALHAREADEEKRDLSVLEDLEALTSMGHGTPSSAILLALSFLLQRRCFEESSSELTNKRPLV